jgi:hypothetical protein
MNNREKMYLPKNLSIVERTMQKVEKATNVLIKYHNITFKFSTTKRLDPVLVRCASDLTDWFLPQQQVPANSK